MVLALVSLQRRATGAIISHREPDPEGELLMQFG